MTKELIENLKKDADFYYTWQANIAVSMQDAYRKAEDKKDIHKISNDGAKLFLDMLIYG